jgi:hypothetical protein
MWLTFDQVSIALDKRKPAIRRKYNSKVISLGEFRLRDRFA